MKIECIVHLVYRVRAVNTFEPVGGLHGNVVVGIEFFVEGKALVIQVDLTPANLHQLTFGVGFIQQDL